MLDLLLQPLSLGFMQRALAASVLVGALTALVGVYVVLRGLAFIGDAISHAAFPGVVIAFVLKLPIYPGAIFAGTFAAGVLILSTIKGYVGDLMGFLFGNVLAVTAGDLAVVAALALLVL